MNDEEKLEFEIYKKVLAIRPIINGLYSDLADSEVEEEMLPFAMEKITKGLPHILVIERELTDYCDKLVYENNGKFKDILHDILSSIKQIKSEFSNFMECSSIDKQQQCIPKLCSLLCKITEQRVKLHSSIIHNRLMFKHNQVHQIIQTRFNFKDIDKSERIIRTFSTMEEAEKFIKSQSDLFDDFDSQDILRMLK